MHVRLQKIGPMDADLEIPVSRFPFVIGRRSESDFSLPLACISRRHCLLTQEGYDVLVQDLKSYHGTYVNGRRALFPLPVKHGDELSLGSVFFRVLIQKDAMEETEAFSPATRAE